MKRLFVLNTMRKTAFNCTSNVHLYRIPMMAKELRLTVPAGAFVLCSIELLEVHIR